MREKLIELLDDFSTPIMLLDTKIMDWNIPTQQLREAIADHLIANDVVEVVRCKDCKHLMFSDCYGECKRGYMGIVKPRDFCSYGERKDNEKMTRTEE